MEDALEYHLWNRGFRDPGQVKLALRAVIYAQMAAKENEAWLDHQLEVEPGSGLTKSVADLVVLFHLNTFINSWRGDEV